MHTNARTHSFSWNLADITLIILLTLLFLAFMMLLLSVAAQPALAQTFSVIHTFNQTDGLDPNNVLLDRVGNLYGSTLGGGSLSDQCTSYGGCGTIYKLAKNNSNWTFQTLYDFPAGNPGATPGPIATSPNGTLYGTTQYGGSSGDGVAFNLNPGPHAGATALNPWQNRVLYSFPGGSDGTGAPGMQGFTFDRQGNMYNAGNCGGNGCVYELTQTSGVWTQNLLYTFSYTDGASPNSGFVFDGAGNLYGTTFDGGSQGGGVIFELTPSAGGWTETVVHNFPAPFMTDTDGWWPTAGLIQDAAGNLYGATLDGGTGGGGVVFMLTPSNDGWNYSVIYNLVSTGLYAGPRASLVLDSLGNLYGTTTTPGCSGSCDQKSHPDQSNRGTVFALAPSNGSWNYYLLYTFTGGSDGADPYYGVVVDSNFNIFGTAREGGNGYGVVFEIAQLN